MSFFRFSFLKNILTLLVDVIKYEGPNSSNQVLRNSCEFVNLALKETEITEFSELTNGNTLCF